MATQPKPAKEGLIKEALHAAENVVDIGLDVDRLKERASRTIEDGIVDAKRMIKRGRYAAEDVLEDTTHLIKHDPWRSVGITFAAGMGIGILMGWMLTRERAECKDSTDVTG